MGRELLTVESAGRLHEVRWDSLLSPADPMQSSGWLSIQERHSRTPLWYTVIRDGDRPVAGLVSVKADDTVPWLLARPDAQLEAARRENRTGAAELLGGIQPDALLPALVCGGRHIGRTRPLLGPDAGREELDDLLTAAESLARAEGLRWVTFPHVDARDASLMEELHERSYTWFESATGCWIDVPTDGMDGYLAGMSQSRRRRVRRDRKEVGAAGFTVSVEPLTVEMAPRLGELDAALLRKYGNPADADSSAAMIGELAERLGDDVLVSVARRDDEIAGFGVLVRQRVGDEEQWHGYRAGFDYETQGSTPLYFEVLYYSAIEAAAAQGVSVLNVGVGSTDAKVAHGCESSEQRCYIKELT